MRFRTYQQGKRPPLGMDRFDSGVLSFDELFTDRFASEAIADVLSVRERDLARAVAPFRIRAPLKELAVGPDSVEAVFDFGKPQYIPGGVVEEVLPALVCLAQLVDIAAAEADGR